MKRLPLFLFILTSIIFITCTKEHLNNTITTNESSNAKVNPNVPQCGTGYHWDYYLGKCVLDCPSGQHNDSITGACVINSSASISVITNSSNPDDTAGARHNQSVNSIIGNVSSTTSNSQIVQLTLNNLYPVGYDTSELRTEYNMSVSLGDFGYTDVDSLASKMYSDGDISVTAKTYLINLSNLLENVIGGTNPTNSTYVAFANNAITYENEIATNNSLSVDEKNMLFSVFSVARYSAAYWGNYINNNNGGGEESSYFQPNFKIHLKGIWKKIIGADAAGAITGGGAAISNNKPVVRGSIFGAIVGSLAEAVKDIINAI